MAFWTKDQQGRIDETLDYIASRVPVNEANTVRTFLGGWVTANYGAASGLLSERMSVSHQTHWYQSVGDKQTRAARRALVILRHEMLSAGQPARMEVNRIMSMASSEVVRSLDAMLPALRIYAHQEANRTLPLQTKLNGLKINPEGFLQHNLVVTQSAPSRNGVGGRVSYRFFYYYAEQQYMLVPATNPRPGGVRGDGITLDVVNVPELYWFNVPGRGRDPAPGNFGQLPCTELTGADLMVTSAFSGCSFCFKSTGGHVYAAHISPDGTASGAGPNIGAAPELARQLIATGDFAAVAGPLQVFGRGLSNLGAYPNGYAVNTTPGVPLVRASMYIVGSRGVGGHNWNLVFQENAAGARRVGQIL
jgi:hypothetical protein